MKLQPAAEDKLRSRELPAVKELALKGPFAHLV